MVDSLKTFNEGEYIYASETNSNNQYLLSKLSDNAAQVQTFVEGEISSIQSNVASIKATLQGNIDAAKTDIYTKGFLPNYSAGVSISSGYKATKNGWVNWFMTGMNDGTTYYLKVNNVVVGESNQYKYLNNKRTQFLVSKGDTITFTGGTGKFFPCKGGI